MARPASVKPIRLTQKFINTIIFGEPGVGKTPFIGTSPNGLILDADVGTESAAIAGSKAEVWPITCHKDLVDVHEYLREEDHEYEWCWLDSATLFQELGMDDIMEDIIAQRPNQDRDVPSQREYLVNMNRIGLWVRHMKALPINFGMTAHVMRIEDETDDGDDIVTYMPDIKGKKGMFSQNICGYMNVVGHLRIAKTKKLGTHQVLTCQRRGSYYGKDRFGVIGTMHNPSIPKIMEAIAPVIAKQTTKKKKSKRRRKA